MIEDKDKIVKIWYDFETHSLKLHAKVRSALFTLPVEFDNKLSFWLANLDDTQSLPDNETIYDLRDIKNKEGDKND
jgi:hypothetical protein